MTTGITRIIRSLATSRFLMISALIHVLIVLLFGGTVLVSKYVAPPDFQAEGGDFVSVSEGEGAPPEPEQALPAPPVNSIVPQVATPTTSLTAITSINSTATAFTIPVVPTVAPSISTNLGDKVASAPSSSSGTTRGQMGRLPGTMGGRGSDRREATMKQSGGKVASEQAVINALRWLQKVQSSDGTWGLKYKGAMTGLSLLCYLGHGETPTTSREFSVVVDKGLKALVAEGSKWQGKLNFHGSKGFASSDSAYQHAIATYALCEAYTMTRDATMPPILQTAVDYIVKGQRSDGGWAYEYDTGPDPDRHGVPKSDTSVSGWQIQALKAAHLTGLRNDAIEATLNSAIRNLDRVYDSKTQTFGYRKAADKHPNLTGIGVLCKLFWQGKPDKMVRDGLKTIGTKDVKYGAGDANLYAWYYDTQACFMAQGGAWDHWNREFQDEIVTHQSPDGSWPPTGGKETGEGMNDAANLDGQIYRTTLCALMLEVYYRYLPTSKETGSGPGAPAGL